MIWKIRFGLSRFIYLYVDYLLSKYENFRIFNFGVVPFQGCHPWNFVTRWWLNTPLFDMAGNSFVSQDKKCTCVMFFLWFIVLQLYSLTISFSVHLAAHVELLSLFTFPIDTLTRITAVPEKQNVDIAITEIGLMVKCW